MFSPLPRISLTQKCVLVPALVLQFSTCNVYSYICIALMMCDTMTCFSISVSLSIWSCKTQCEGRRLPTGIAFGFPVPLFKYRALTNISECWFWCGYMQYIIGFLSAFAVLREATIIFVMYFLMSAGLSVCPSAWNNSAASLQKFEMSLFFENLLRKLEFR